MGAPPIVLAVDWNEWVALGTLSLANVTVVVAAIGVATAWFTRQLAEQTKTLAEATQGALLVAQAELAAQVRPLIVDVPETLDAGPMADYGDGVTLPAYGAQTFTDILGQAILSVPIRNVGPGLAFIAEKPLMSRDITGYKFEGRSSRHALPPDEIARLSFRLSDAGLMQMSNVYVEVSYTDVGGQQATRSVLFFRYHGADSEFRVAGVAIYEIGSDTPIVANGEGFD
jgi:hypothetical protein